MPFTPMFLVPTKNIHSTRLPTTHLHNTAERRTNNFTQNLARAILIDGLLARMRILRCCIFVFDIVGLPRPFFFFEVSQMTMKQERTDRHNTKTYKNPKDNKQTHQATKTCKRTSRKTILIEHNVHETK